jgi:hypothetical protein
MMKDIKYIEDDLVDVFDEVLEYSKKLIEIINNTSSYIEKLLK